MTTVDETPIVTGAPAGSASPIEVAIKSDHDGIKGLYQKIKSPVMDKDSRQKLAWQLLRDLTIHALAEEEVLYPEVTRRMNTDERNHALDEHTSLKCIAVELDGMTVDDPSFMARMDELMQELEHHTQEEEDDLLPRLAGLMGGEENRELRDNFEKAKGHLPTRPHLYAPDKPSTGNVVMNRLTMPIDAARDKLRWGNDEIPSTVLHKEFY